MQSVGPKQNPDTTDRSRATAPARWPLGRLIAVSLGAVVLATAVAVPSVLGALGLWGTAHFQDSSGLDVVKLVFTVIAGLGALVGLVIAYRRQLISEFADGRENTRLFNERFSTAAEQLGSDQVGVRLAGVYSMEGLADDWPAGRQKCVDVLCALVRRGHGDEPAEPEYDEARMAWEDGRQFRHAIIRVVAQHLRPGAAVPWARCDFDFTGAVVDGGDFEGIELAGGRLVFADARFVAGSLVLRGSRILGGLLDARGAVFGGGTLDLAKSVIEAGATVNFSDADFAAGRLDLAEARVAGTVYFCRASFHGTTVKFSGGDLSGSVGVLDFREARLAGGQLLLDRTVVEASVFDFRDAAFGGMEADVSDAVVRGTFPAAG